VFWKVFGRTNAREHLTIYLLATMSNLFLSIAEYLAVRQAVASYLPLDSGTAQLIANYGTGLGLGFDFLWTLAIFQGLLTIILLSMTLVPLLNRGWRVSYIISGLVISGFVGYWLAAKFLRTLGWVSQLETNGVNAMGVYSDLFWLGLAAAMCYVTMILVLRKSYDKIFESNSSLRQHIS
jgi:hypothetical protein